MDYPKLERRHDNDLLATDTGDGTASVQPRRCFPWSAPRRFVSLRGPENKEVALIRDLAELDDDTRALVEAGLAETAFVFEVESVDTIDTEFEIRNWKVRTHQGRTTFQTKLDEWPRPTVAGELLLRDVSGNLFRFAPPERMDARSRKLLWAFID